MEIAGEYWRSLQHPCGVVPAGAAGISYLRLFFTPKVVVL